MGKEVFSLLEELARMNPFLFAEHRFYTTGEGITGFVYEEDDSAVKILLANGEYFSFLKGLKNAGVKQATTRQKIGWKYDALLALDVIGEAERIINS